ncbi:MULTISPECIES: hypothetical protein [Staphylococcus]|uniref:hypothetical protein n=1 Tax=Staphylococcus TaxID=1279 RepID=UPI0015A58B77|nr:MULTISPECIES: hypothetical protein [Staphylococcus]MEB8124491.1 hypothetical protein [Staphylococcus succinus]
MQLKTFTAFTEKTLDKRVNAFLKKDNIKVLEIQTNSNWLYISATLIYEEKSESETS